ncbi:MAG TPA: TolC family protein [Candidatus Sumerlaeota bacterium]|nr:TolC family protein [Candidatus Sumerlaeota bacterium]
MTRWWPFLLVLATAGCARFQDRPLSASRNLEAFETRTLDREDLKTYLQATVPVSEWPPKTWNLTELTLAAFFFNPDLDVARAQLVTSKGGEKAAGERPNPTLSVKPSFNSTTPASSSISPWILENALDIPIETAGKRGYRIAEAQELSESARLKIATAAWLVRSHVRQALLDLYTARETETQLNHQQTIQADNVRLLEQQQTAGEVSPFEVSQARIPLNATRLAVGDAQKKQAQARAQLATAIGIPLQALEGRDFSFDAFEKIPQNLPEAQTRRLALLSRPDILAALAEYQASQSALQLEIAKQYPDLNIGPGYAYDQSENKWALGISLTLPVFNQNQGAIATAEGRRAEAEARFNALQTSVTGQIEQAETNFQSSLKKLKTAQSLTEELKKKAENTRKQFEAGEILKLEVATADLEVSTNVLAELSARIEVLQALGQIEDALQQPSDLPQWQQSVSPHPEESRREMRHE